MSAESGVKSEEYRVLRAERTVVRAECGVKSIASSEWGVRASAKLPDQRRTR